MCRALLAIAFRIHFVKHRRPARAAVLFPIATALLGCLALSRVIPADGQKIATAFAIIGLQYHWRKSLPVDGGKGVYAVRAVWIVALLWILIYSYMILASIDFGAGYYYFYGQVIAKKNTAFSLIQHYLSPVTEIGNVCFVLLLAALTVFSQAIPLADQQCLAFSALTGVALILIKGTFYAVVQLLQGHRRVQRFCIAGNGMTGLLIPPILGISLVVSEGGVVDAAANGGSGAIVAYLLANPYFWSVMCITLVSIFYIGSMYFTAFAHVLHDETLSDIMREHALVWSMPTVLASGFVFLGLEMQNPAHFNRALDHWWLFLLSLICLFFAVALVFLKRWYRLSFLFVMLQYFFAFSGYLLSHLPYLIYPDVRIPSAAAATVNGWIFFTVLLLSLTVVLFTLNLHGAAVRKMTS
jgi:cytochrome d ubiquinol oxidase subunit II